MKKIFAIAVVILVIFAIGAFVMLKHSFRRPLS